MTETSDDIWRKRFQTFMLIRVFGVAMFLLASIPMKEARMLARRPGYAERQRRVALLVPWPPRA